MFIVLILQLGEGFGVYRKIMNKLIRLFSLTALLLLPLAHVSATDKVVNIVTGYSLGPYVLKNGGGILSDIIKESLLLSGFDTQLSYMSNADALSFFEKNQYDAVTVVKPGMVKGFMSVPVVSFNNQFITLAQSKIKIKELSDMKGLSVIAFSKATAFMGERFNQAVKQSSKYREVDDQEDQVIALFTGEADAILADEIIFKFFRKRLQYKNLGDTRFEQTVSFQYKFAPTFYNIAFRDEKHQQAFDAGYQRLVKSGRIDDIYNYYIELLGGY